MRLEDEATGVLEFEETVVPQLVRRSKDEAKRIKCFFEVIVFSFP